jgi:hypothetical protein
MLGAAAVVFSFVFSANGAYAAGFREAGFRSPNAINYDGGIALADEGDGNRWSFD